MSKLRWLVRAGLVAVLLGILYVGVTFLQVVQAAGENEEVPSDAIVVLGAAQWNGVPSPVLAGRLDRGVELWEQGLAPVIVVVGGKQAGDEVTQGMAGFNYLREAGVPEEALRVEVEGTDTFTEMSAVAGILESEGFGTDVLVVSDPYHSMRAAAIAREVGLDPHVAPTDRDASSTELMRETAAVSAGRILGYRRLSNWT